MGNSKKGVKPRPARQPKKLLLSGDTTAIAVGGGKGGATADTSVDIKLVQIELGVAAQVMIDNFVQVQWQGTQFEVYFEGQRLGNIPGNYDATLLPQLQHRGRLVKIAIYADPINIIVRIKLLLNHQ